MTKNLSHLTIENIKEAAVAFNGVIKHTPTAHAITISKMTGANVYLKFENR